MVRKTPHRHRSGIASRCLQLGALVAALAACGHRDAVVDAAGSPDAADETDAAVDATDAAAEADATGSADAADEADAAVAATDATDAALDSTDAAVDIVDDWTPAELTGVHWYVADDGVDLDGLVADVWSWDQPGLAAPWHPRDGAGLVHFRDRLWLLGGWYVPGVVEWNLEVTTNEVWSSGDDGATWTLELAHDSSPPATGPGARWVPRHTFGALVLEVGGVPYLYVVGGDIYHVTADVWRSADGVTWELVTDAAPWGADGRVLHMTGALGADLYVMGGQRDIYDPATCLADVWRSRDGGFTWDRLADAPWAPRGMIYHLAEHQGRLWLAGGGTYDDAPRTFYNDVWAFDGETWERISAAAPWVGREYHNVTTFAGELWVSSGWAADELNHNDFWHSADGVTWTELVGVPVLPGHGDGVAATADALFHASGNAMDTAVHRLRRGAFQAAPITRWRDRVGGADLLAEGRARPLHRTNAFGSRPGVSLDGTDQLMRLAEREPHPSGRTIFWLGRTGRTLAAVDFVNPSMTVVGDSTGACRGQAGYSGDQIELVVTDATGAWSGGHVLRGAGVTDDRPHLVGFTQATDGTVRVWLDGAEMPPVERLSYDGEYMGWDRLGAGFAEVNRAQVVLGFVLVAPRVLDDATIDRLTRYAQRWLSP